MALFWARGLEWHAAEGAQLSGDRFGRLRPKSSQVTGSPVEAQHLVGAAASAIEGA